MTLLNRNLLALILAGTCPLGFPVEAYAQTAPQGGALDEARQRHEQGRAYEALNPPNYGAALVEYQRAYEIMAGHPLRYLELNNIASCYQNLGEYDLALDYYERFLREGGPDARDRPRVEATIQALLSTLGTLEIETNVASAEVWSENRRIGTAPGRVRVPGGRHLIELRASGHTSERREVSVASRQMVPLRVELEVIRPGRRLSPAFFWTGVGLSLASAATGAVFGGLAISARSDVDQRLASSSPSVRFSVTAEDQQSIANRALLADVFFISAGALAIGTTVLGLLTDFRGHAEESTQAPSPRVAFIPLTSGGHLTLQGSF